MGNYFSQDDTTEMSRLAINGDDAQVVESPLTLGKMWKQPSSTTGIREILPYKWKERYFHLLRGGLFYYTFQLEHAIPLDLVDEVELGPPCQTSPGKAGYQIHVTDKDRRLFQFATSAVYEAQEWINALASGSISKRGLAHFFHSINKTWTECALELEAGKLTVYSMLVFFVSIL